MKNPPTIEVETVREAGDALRIEYTASYDGRSVPCLIWTTAHKSDELQAVLEREGAHHLGLRPLKS